ncbi:MAG: glutamine-hydrolyzing GMP synthase [Chthonomonadales bacterium]|nr:glutamine-hydrolyzing GMP synthase [Chthonomonadales bacterium]
MGSSPALDSSCVNPTDESVIILDFGAQYTQLIARRIRECGVYCEIEPYTLSAADILRAAPRGLVLSGGPSSVYDEGAPTVDSAVFGLGIPVLGICYGHQLMARLLGGDVAVAASREYGPASIEVIGGGDLMDAEWTGMQCWMSHGDTVRTAPSGFEVTARTARTPVAVMEDRTRRLYGVQFHPEVVHTAFGKDVLWRFVRDVCGCSGLWDAGSFIEEAVAEIRAAVGNKGVLCGVSGGVDSCTVAALVHRAIGDQLTCVFVDHGLLRQGEREQVEQDFAAALGIRLISVDARDRFLRRLRGVTDPEEKRKAIGEEFIRVFEECARGIEGAVFLAQGTLYPDVIESGGGAAATIKSHHNVGGLPEVMGLDVLEPIRYLFKDEVRKVASALGLPDGIVWRHPFPGPGLAIRITGEVTEETLETVRSADAIFLEELHRAGVYHEVWQAFAALAPGTRTVGVMGDARTYSHPVILRAVTSEDGMTADWARLPYDLLQRVSSRIANEVPGVNRVVYDISSKPPATIEWE